MKEMKMELVGEKLPLWREILIAILVIILGLIAIALLPITLTCKGLWWSYKKLFPKAYSKFMYKQHSQTCEYCEEKKLMFYYAYETKIFGTDACKDPSGQICTDCAKGYFDY